MRPLIDGDILRYEVGAIAQKEDGPASFDFVAGCLDGRILDICEAVGATEPPILYLTGKTNFRHGIAVTKPYKGNRKNEKPWHFNNITAYMHNQYEVRIQEGLEADDLMSIDQAEDTVICTRDKDLRMVPGWHYGWECGAQREFPLQKLDKMGHLRLTAYEGKPPKLTGTGLRFFYAQLLMGDSGDNIPGLPRVGPAKTYEVLGKRPLSEQSLWERVKKLYEDKGKDNEYLMEQAHLLWMVRELTEEGHPVLWQPPS